MIHIASTYIADVLGPSLDNVLQKFSSESIQFHYNQIFQQALSLDSEFNQNNQGLNVILIRSKDLFKAENRTIELINELSVALNQLQKTMKVPLLIVFTPTSTQSLAEQNHYVHLEKSLQSSLAPNANTLWVTSLEIPLLSDDSDIFDSVAEKYGHIPYFLSFYESLAYLIARKYSLLNRKPYKVIVLDCDGTLWDGVVEEDGVKGLIINAQFQAFQQFMVELHQAGFLLCLCSKNSEHSILNAFSNHNKMVLDIQKHICSYRINWSTKSANIQSLAKELELNLDSFIFIDDNAIECAEVSAALPCVLVLHLPKIESRINFLKHIWAFDQKSKSFEDEHRTTFYQQNKLRHSLQSQSASYDQFLVDLEINTAITPATEEELERIIQLSLRTNQFNLVPDAISDIEFTHRIMEAKSPTCLSIKVSDKYGDYGLVGVLVYDILEDAIIIQAMFLSCRILGRQIEYQLINYVSNIAQQLNKYQIKFSFKVTDRNVPAMGFLKHLSGQETLPQNNQIELPLSTLKTIKPQIYHSKSNTNSTTHNNTSLNDFFVEVAHFYLKNQDNLSDAKQVISIENRLLILFKQCNITLGDDKAIPLIALGLDSLTCVLITSAIYQHFSVEIVPFELLKTDFTLDRLVQYIVKEAVHPKMKLPSVKMGFLSLSLNQKQLWDDEQMYLGGSRNNMFSAYQFTGDVDVFILEKSFNDLISRHDSLRFSFNNQHNYPELTLNELNSISFSIKTDIMSGEVDIDHYIHQFRSAPFVLAKAPLFRVALLKNNQSSMLLFCIHHLIHDGWSLNILMDELSAIYSAYSNNDIAPNLNQPPSYVQYIQWQNQQITQKHLDNQKLFWAKQLMNIPQLDLIYDFAQKEGNKNKISQRIAFELNSTTTQKLKRLSTTNQVTLYTTLTSAFGVLLSHYTDQKTIVFSTALSGRNHPQLVNAIGLFTRLIMLTMHIDAQETFNNLLKRNKINLEDILNHQDLSFSDILHSSHEQNHSPIHALTQAGFIFQSYPIHPLNFNNLIGKRVFADDNAELIYDSSSQCRFGNLVCYMQEYKGELHGIFEYNIALFAKKRIKLMIDSFKTLLNNLCETPYNSAFCVSMVSAKQKQLFTTWNQPAVKVNKTLTHYFSEQVSNNPQAIAVKHNELYITYEELDKLSNQLASKLVQKGIQRETRVGIYVEQGISRIVALLGILKAGGCYVPLEKELPIYRMNSIINDTLLSLIITDTNDSMQFIKKNFTHTQPFLIYEPINHFLESDYPLPKLCDPKQLVYIMHTSGSTGNPKGIAIEHSGIVRLVKSPNYIEFKSSDCIAQTSSFLFDGATFEIWGALLNGATLVLVDKNKLLNANALNTIIKEQSVSILFLSTQLFHTYSYLAPYLFNHLKYVVLGGEALSFDAVKQVLKQKNRPFCIINGYGPTENTTFSTTYSIKNLAELANPIPIGKPITGTKAYVLDDSLNLCPVGAPGTLYLGGIGLTRGYINQPELNQKKFIDYWGERLYETGDLVTWKIDGTLKYLGRRDNQIKINGHRIELDEIEAQLKTHRHVAQAIVIIKNKRYQKQLAAFILLKPGYDLQHINLYHYLKTILPQYMLPTQFYQIDDIPLTIQGKVDKSLLLKKKLIPISYQEYAPAMDDQQKQLLDIYAELLNAPAGELSINADFFDLGGTSISALHLIDKINQHFSVNINFSELYEFASIKSLSEQITVLGKNTCSTIINDSRTLQLVKPGNSQKIPIVFIHPIGGSGFCYRNLIKLLPDDQPCYLIQDPSLEADCIYFNDMPSMATYYNQLLLKKFKNKPYILSGYSFGGMLSLEMASQLESQHLEATVPLVIALDTWVISNFLNVEAKEALRLSIMKKYKQVSTDLKAENINPKPWMKLYYNRLQNLGFAYNPPIINQKIVLFKAIQQVDEFSAMNDVSNYLHYHSKQPVDVYNVSGNHDSILQYPHVNEIGRLLSQYLQNNIS